MRELDAQSKMLLCSSIRTSRYSRKVVSLLRDLSDGLYKTDQADSVKNLDTLMDEELAGVMNKILESTDLDKPMDVEHILRQIINFLNGVEEVNFVIPIIPKKEFVKRLYDWCVQNIRGEILLNFTTNRLMDSGFLMIYKGKYFEYSLENLLNEYLGSHDLGTYFDRAVAVTTQPSQEVQN